MNILEEKTEFRPAATWKKLTSRRKSSQAQAEELIKFSVNCLREEPVPPQALNRTLARLDLLGAPKRYTRFKWRPSVRRFSIVSTSVSVAMVSLGSLWMWHVDQAPQITVPTHAMPAVNSFNDFKSAGAGIIDSKHIDEALVQLSKSSLQDDFSPYQVFKTDITTFNSEALNKTGFSSEQMKALVAENRPSIERLKEGLAKPYLEPSVRSSTTLFPYLSDYRSLARLLLLDSRLKARDGDWNQSIQRNLDTIQLGNEIPHGGAMIQKLVGIACESIGRQNIWGTIDHLNATETRAALSRLQTILKRRVKVSEVLQEEKYYSESSLLEIFRSPFWRFEWSENAMNLQDYNSMQINLAKAARFIIDRRFANSKTQILNQLDDYMNEQIKFADQPFGTQSISSSHNAEYIAALDPVLRILLPVSDGISFQDAASSQVQNELLKTSLALHAYKLEHGHYPNALVELLNGYLPEMPADSFAAHETLKYFLNGDKYTLYSVGPDGKDDLGKPIINRAASNPSQNHIVQQGSTGDIVAGVNGNAESSD